MDELSKRERDGHWYVPGKTEHEKIHVNEHQTLQQLQRHALNGKHDEFFELLETIPGSDKRQDIIMMCNMHGSEHGKHKHQN